MPRRLLLICLAVSSFGAACDNGTTNTPCINNQCPPGQQCVNNVCIPIDGGSLDGISRGDSINGGDGLSVNDDFSANYDGFPRDTLADHQGANTDGNHPDGLLKDFEAAQDLSMTDSFKVDSSISDFMQPDLCSVPCGGTCCRSHEQCAYGTCYTPIGNCQTNEECFNDYYCQDGTCLPYGVGPISSFNPNCLRVIPAGIFSPALQCEWKGPPSGDAYPNHKNVLSTPVVVDFGNQGEAGSPSIVFVSYDRNDGGGESAKCDSGAYGIIRILRGTDCAQLWTVADVKVRPSGPLAIADLDNDNRPEIVAYRCGGGVVAVQYDQNQNKFVQMWVSNPSTTASNETLWSGPSIHDLNKDGKPEILMGGVVFNNQGQLLDGSLGTLTPSSHNGGFAVVADVDADGIPEIVNGKSVWEWNPVTDKWVLDQNSTNATGLVAVADFGTYGSDSTKDDRSKLDGIAEIAVVQNGKVVVQTVAGRVVFGPVNLPNGGSGGPPTVGDFDKDGRAELACAGYGAYTVFDPDCRGTPNQSTCPSLTTTGILWSQPSQDYSSSSTGSSIFDFEGDGSAEAVYADECFARVYEGATGEVIYSQYHTSCTWYENPVVADVDRDFQSELIVPSNTNCSKYSTCNGNYAKLPGTNLAMDPLFKGIRCKVATDCPSGNCNAGFCRCQNDTDCGGNDSYRCGPPVSGTPGSGNVCRSVILGEVSGIRVYRDIQDRWVDSRTIWNQHAYSVTNINDDGTIPATGVWQKNWTIPGMNNFRQNQQGTLNPSAVPDLTSNLANGIQCEANNLVVQAQVCNRGTKQVGAGVNVAVYLGNPQNGGKLGCVAQTPKVLYIGTCETVSCTITPKPTSEVDLYVVADNDGTGQGSYVECFDQNNWAVIKSVFCP